MHCLVLKKLTTKQCIVSAVHAPVQEHQKDYFWQHLHDFIDKPWCIMGDYWNTSYIRKIGVTPLNTSKVQRIDQILHYSNNYDGNVQSRLFTWKKLLWGKLVYEKLDIVLFRGDCLQLFPNYLVTNGPFTCSDHAYVLLSTNPTHSPMRETMFKYQHS